MEPKSIPPFSDSNPATALPLVPHESRDRLEPSPASPAPLGEERDPLPAGGIAETKIPRKNSSVEAGTPENDPEQPRPTRDQDSLD